MSVGVDSSITTTASTPQRKIVHVDMDCFYAAVEIRDNPSLRGRPVAVGGSPQGRGVLSTANYEARKYGVRSAMSSARAIKLCPDLVILRGNFYKYREASRQIREIFERYTSIIQPLSLDEAYLDLTDCDAFNNSATKIAQAIRKEIYVATHLTASAGIAPNKFLAKVASDWNKPNNQFTVTPSQVAEFVRQLPVDKIPGVGKVTATNMKNRGLHTCADLQALSIEELTAYFGVFGERLFEVCRGIDNRRVSEGGERKSFSVERTFQRDLSSVDDCLQSLRDVYREFQKRLNNSSLSNKIRSLFVKVKFHDFTQTTYDSSEHRLPTLTNFNEMVETAYFREAKPVRLLGLGVRLQAEVKRTRTPGQLQFPFAS